jgi:hypothetical protein
MLSVGCCWFCGQRGQQIRITPAFEGMEVEGLMIRPLSLLVQRFRTICLTADSCVQRGLVAKRETWLTAKAMLGRVLLERYCNIPIADR